LTEKFAADQFFFLKSRSSHWIFRLLGQHTQFQLFEIADQVWESSKSREKCFVIRIQIS